MMRCFYSLCLAVGAMGLPVAASPVADGHVSASSAKGARSGAVVSATDSTPAQQPKASSQPWIVVTPRLPDPRDGIFVHHTDSAQVPATGPYVQGIPSYRQMSVTAYQPSVETETPVQETNGRMSVTTMTVRTSLTTAIVRASTATMNVRTEPTSSRNASTVSRTFADTDSSPSAVPNGRLARVTAYWPAEGDYYTRHGVASTGVRLHDGHCAVDPNIIPYGSVVDIAGVGKFLAVDTGTAVVERTAAREAGHTRAERNALVIDLFFESRREGEAFASSAAKWAPISWWTPSSTASQAKEARSLFAEEDWSKIQSKQL